MHAAAAACADRARRTRLLARGNVEHQANVAIVVRYAAAANQPEWVGELEAVAGLQSQNRATEEHPGIELIVRQAQRNVIDALQPGVQAIRDLLVDGFEIDFEKACWA